MSENEVPTRQLKNLIVNPQVQYKLIMIFVGLFFITTSTLYSTFYLFFWRFKEKALSVGIPEGHVFFNFLSDQKSSLDSLFISIAVINLLLLIIVSIVVSHRIAGPIQKLKIHLAAMDHDAEDFKLREDDFFNDIGPVVNKLREKFKA